MIDLSWTGPYAVGDLSEFPNYRTAGRPPGYDGLYCWCVEVGGVFLPTYIGKSAGKTVGVISRVDAEKKDALVGRYQQLLDVDEFKNGRRLVLRERFSDASEKSGLNKAVHAQHQREYKETVNASLVFFARIPEGTGASVIQIERSTIARVQASGLDMAPLTSPDKGHYERLLTHAPCKKSVEIRHRCEHKIRGLTESKTGGVAGSTEKSRTSRLEWQRME